MSRNVATSGADAGPDKGAKADLSNVRQVDQSEARSPDGVEADVTDRTSRKAISPAEQRKARLAAELRQNLRRRKAPPSSKG